MSNSPTAPPDGAERFRLSEPQMRYLQLVDLSELLEIALVRLDALKSAAFREMTQGQNALF